MNKEKDSKSKKEKKKNKRDSKANINWSFILSIFALLISFITLYMQYYYEKTSLQIGNIHLSDISDTLYENRTVNIKLLLLNTGTNPIAFTESYSFISTNESLPNNRYYDSNILPNNSAIYTCCYSNINKVVEPNSVQFIDLNLTIKKENLDQYITLNKLDQRNYLNIGLHLIFVDSNGEKIIKELVVGKTQFNNKHTIFKEYKGQEHGLTFY